MSGVPELLRPLGRGAMGVVHEARLPGDPRRLAIKLLEGAAGSVALERFRREGELAARLNHPGIVAVHSTGVLPDGRPYLLFDLVEGGVDLGEQLTRSGALPQERVLALARELCAALAHAHAAGVVHRDVKPANVLLDADDRLRLTDFGIARATDMEQLTRTGQLVGTPRYLAPEQIHGGAQVGPWTDVHAVGLLLFELLTGRPAFEGEGVELLARVASHRPPNLCSLDPTLSPELAQVVARCLEKDPQSRYPHASALLEAIEQVDPSRSSRGLGAQVKLLAALALVAALLALAAVGVLARRRLATTGPAEPLATLAEPVAPRAVPVALEPRWEVGETLRSELTLRLDYFPSATSSYAMRWSLTQRVVAVEATAVALEITIDAFSFETLSSIAGRLVYDSRAPSINSSELAYLDGLAGQVLRVRLSRRDHSVLELDGLEALDRRLEERARQRGLAGAAARAVVSASMWQHLDQALGVLPAEPVLPGGEWRTEFGTTPTGAQQRLLVARRLSLSDHDEARSLIDARLDDLRWAPGVDGGELPRDAALRGRALWSGDRLQRSRSVLVLRRGEQMLRTELTYALEDAPRWPEEPPAEPAPASPPPPPALTWQLEPGRELRATLWRELVGLDGSGATLGLTLRHRVLSAGPPLELESEVLDLDFRQGVDDEASTDEALREAGAGLVVRWTIDPRTGQVDGMQGWSALADRLGKPAPIVVTDFAVEMLLERLHHVLPNQPASVGDSWVVPIGLMGEGCTALLRVTLESHEEGVYRLTWTTERLLLWGEAFPTDLYQLNGWARFGGARLLESWYEEQEAGRQGSRIHRSTSYALQDP